MSFFRSLIPEPERREFSLSRWTNWLDGLTSGETAAGIEITDQTALKWAVVWGCVLVLAQDVAKLPLPVYRRVGDDGREQAREHALWDVLNVAANPFMTAYQFRQTLQKHLNIRGNAYAMIERTGSKITALWPRMPDRMQLEVENGWPVYWYERDNGERQRLTPDEVFHLRGLSDDGIVGISPVEVFREGIALGLAAQNHAAKQFGQGVRSPFIIRAPEGFNREKASQFSDYWQRNFSGQQNVGKTPILYGGMDITNVGFSNKDAEFVESRRFSAEDAYKVWRVPPTKVMDFLRATFSNITETNIAYVGDTLMPHQRNWEAEIHQKLMLPGERQEFYVEHNNTALLKGTPKDRAEVEEIYVRSGISQPNEVRRSHNWNPVEGGDVNVVQMQMMRLIDLGRQFEEQLNRMKGGLDNGSGNQDN